MRLPAVLRTAFFRLTIVALAAGSTIVACGSQGGSMRPPIIPSVSSPTPSGGNGLGASSEAEDPDLALEQAVAQAHQRTFGRTTYTVQDGGWYQPSPAPGRPGYYLIDDEVVPGPPNDPPPGERPAGEPAPGDIIAPRSLSDEAAPAPTATPNCNVFDVDVPPPCTATGPFRRVYSGPGYSFALAHLTLPADNPAMPTAPPPTKAVPSPTPLNGDTGYIYFEGWVVGKTAAGNSEFGFQYSAKHHWYSVYYKTLANPNGFYVLSNHYTPATPVTFALASYDVGNQNELHVALIGTTQEPCLAGPKLVTKPVGALCLVHDHEPDAGWIPKACCIMARMTTIGQSKPEKFYDNVSFGPVKWSGAQLAVVPPTPLPKSTILPLTGGEPAWSGGGSQSWPPQLNKIVVDGESPTGETDTVDLTPLPDVNVAISPASCQYVPAKKGGGADAKLNYTASTAGSAGGLRLEYGFDVGDFSILPVTLKVPGDTSNGNGVFVGPSKTATLDVVGTTEAGGFATNIYANLYFFDARGVLTGDWNGVPRAAASPVRVGNKKC